MKLDLSKKEINYTLYGLVLGNGYYKDGVIHIERPNQKKFYIQWLEQLCKSLNIKHDVDYDYIRKNSKPKLSEFSKIRIWVPDRRHFENNRIVDTNNKKIISTYILKRITPLGLLIWYLDKGYLHVSIKENKAKRFAYLNTQAFSKFEINLIRKMFEERFGIITTLHEEKKKITKQNDEKSYMLYFNANNFKIFFDVVRPFLSIIPAELRYKFNMKYKPNHRNDNAEILEKYNLE